MMEQKIEAVLHADVAQVRLPDDLMDRIKGEAAKPVPRRRPFLQWTAAAVLALALAGVADWSLGTGAVAAVLKRLGVLVQVRGLDATEVQELAEYLNDPEWPTRNPRPNEPYRTASGNKSSVLANVEVTPAEAQQAVLYPLLRPKALSEPEKGILLEPDDPLGRVTLVYEQGSIRITQHYLAEGEMVRYDAPEEAIEDVTVAGQPAVVIRGAFVGQPDGSVTWTPDFSVNLVLERDRQYIDIRVLRADFPTEELIQLAESLE